MELVALPVEVIQLIAGYLLVSPDILSLAKTCHSLYNACHNAAVFQQSFELYLPQVSSHDIRNKATLIRLVRDQVERQSFLQKEDPKTLWFLLAAGAVQIPGVTHRLTRAAAAASVLAARGQRVGPELQTRLRSAVILLSTLSVWRFDAASGPAVVDAFDTLCPVLLGPSQSPRAGSESEERYRIDKLLGLESAVHFAWSFALGNLRSAHDGHHGHRSRRSTAEATMATATPAKAHEQPATRSRALATESLARFARSVYEGIGIGGGSDGYHDGFGAYPQGAQTQALLLIVLISRIIRHDAYHREGGEGEGHEGQQLEQEGEALGERAEGSEGEPGRRPPLRLRLPHMDRLALLGGTSSPTSPLDTNTNTAPSPPSSGTGTVTATAPTTTTKTATHSVCPLYCHADQVSPGAFRRGAGPRRAAALRGPVSDTWSDWYVERALAVADSICGRQPPQQQQHDCGQRSEGEQGVKTEEEEEEEEQGEEWYGFYTHGLDLSKRLDAPMEGIRFRKAAAASTSSSSSSAAHADTSGIGAGFDAKTTAATTTSRSRRASKQAVEAAGCRDGFSTFALRGHVGADLAVSLRKQHATHAFAYDGTVTPLGICGTYRLLGGSQVLGYFWIWPRAWMAAT